MDELLVDLTSGDDVKAESAARKLAASGDIALQKLQELCTHTQAEVRWWAVRALAEFPGEQSAPALIQALGDKDRAVRQCAALALYQRPTEAAVPALLKTMSSSDSLLARLSANALVSLGSPAVPGLLELMEKADSAVRLEAARALASIADPRAIPAFMRALEEGSALLDYWASEGLERMGVGMVYFKP